MKKLREKVRNDHILHEEQKERERYAARKEAGKIKSISDMSEREKRKVRKAWRNRSRKSYYVRKEQENLNRILEENTPPSSPVALEELQAGPSHRHQESIAGPSRQHITGKKIQRQNREKLKSEIKYLRERLKKSEMKVEKYKKELLD